MASSAGESLWKVGVRKTAGVRWTILSTIGGTGSTATAMHIEMQQFLLALS